MDIGKSMYDLCSRIFPICRSITGDGVRQTLYILREMCPSLMIHEVPSGTKVFDWTVPKEWIIRGAWIKNQNGETVLDFTTSNLHVLGYSLPIDQIMSLPQLKEMIYTQPDQPDAVPYVTSYYQERSGFCMSEKQKNSLPEGMYHAYIDSELKDGSLTYGEIIIPGECEQEILFSTYICHPSMANDNISGPSVIAYLAKWLSAMEHRRYTYRLVFVPETIGAITYLSRNLSVMKQRTIAGFNVSCVGDDRTYSYIASRDGNTLADRVMKNVLHYHYPDYQQYSFLARGSDERQYDAPGVDLPICGFCRSKYGAYPEYHTSKDNMNIISPAGLAGAYEVLQQCVEALENNRAFRVKCLCETQLGKRGLYPTVSQKGSYDTVESMFNFIAYADGNNDLIEISNIIDAPIYRLIPIVQTLTLNELI